MEHVILHVYYRCKSGMAREFVQALKSGGLQEKVRGEDGCLQYDYHLSCEKPDTVVLLEKWRDAAALERHLAQPHMVEIGRVKEAFVERTDLEKFVSRNSIT